MIVGFTVGTLLYYAGDWSFPVVMLILALISGTLFVTYKVLSLHVTKSTARQSHHPKSTVP